MNMHINVKSFMKSRKKTECPLLHSIHVPINIPVNVSLEVHSVGVAITCLQKICIQLDKQNLQMNQMGNQNSPRKY